MVHGVVGMGVVIQILIKITAFGAKAFIKRPAEACKGTVLIETRLATRWCRIGANEELVSSDQT